jgi:nucleoside diphosphate kinase
MERTYIMLKPDAVERKLAERLSIGSNQRDTGSRQSRS